MRQIAGIPSTVHRTPVDVWLLMVGWTELRREPFRLLFPLGTLYGLLGITHWLVYALGWAPTYSRSGSFHAGLQVGAYMMCFIVGFLLTALPRFAATTPATSTELIVLLSLLLAQPLLLSLGQWAIAQGVFAAVLVALAVFAVRRFAARTATLDPPTEFVWIGFALLHGLIGAGLLMGAQLGWLPVWLVGVGRPMAQQGFLLSIVLGVGGFMAPRLMGRTTLQIPASGISEQATRRIRRHHLHGHVAAGALLFATFWWEGAGGVRFAYLLRAAIVTIELLWTTHCYRRPVSRELYVRYLWGSLWMILFGLWGAGLVVRLRVAMLHILFLGGLSLMTFAVATMVVLSHSGVGQRLREPLWVLPIIGLGIGGASSFRLAAELLPAHFFTLLGVAAACWSLAGLSWLVFAWPYVMRRVPVQTFERAHDDAKRSLSQTAHGAAPL